MSRDNSQYENIPANALEGLNMWAIFARPVGDALMGFLTNDLRRAIGHSGQPYRDEFFNIFSYIYNRLPSPCWGSKEVVNEYKKMIRSRRQDGRRSIIEPRDGMLVWPNGEVPEYIIDEYERHFGVDAAREMNDEWDRRERLLRERDDDDDRR